MGYPKSLFAATPPQFLICPLCLDPYKEPSVICRQYHMVCKDCIPSLDSCVVCRSEVDHDATQHPVDINIDRFVKSLHMRCQRREHGCQWTGPVSSEAMHAESCDYLDMKCPNQYCTVQVLKRDLEAHKESCRFTLHPCTNTLFCKRMSNRSDMFRHAPTCEWNPCIWSKVDGCPFKGTASALAAHQSYCSKIHDELLALRERVKESECASESESTAVSLVPSKEPLEYDSNTVSQFDSRSDDKVDLTLALAQMSPPAASNLGPISVGRMRESEVSSPGESRSPGAETSVEATSIPPKPAHAQSDSTFSLEDTVTSPSSPPLLFTAVLPSRPSDANEKYIVTTPSVPTSVIPASPMSKSNLRKLKTISLPSKPSNEIGALPLTRPDPTLSSSIAGRRSSFFKRESYVHLTWTKRQPPEENDGANAPDTSTSGDLASCKADVGPNTAHEHQQHRELRPRKKVRISLPEDDGDERQRAGRRNPRGTRASHCKGGPKHRGGFRATTNLSHANAIGSTNIGGPRAALNSNMTKGGRSATRAFIPVMASTLATLNKHGRTPRRYPEDDEEETRLIVTQHPPPALPSFRQEGDEEPEGLVVTPLTTTPKVPSSTSTSAPVEATVSSSQSPLSSTSNFLDSKIQSQNATLSPSFVSNIPLSSSLLLPEATDYPTNIPSERYSEQNSTGSAPFCAYRSPKVDTEADAEVAAMLHIAYPSPLSEHAVPINEEKAGALATINIATLQFPNPQLTFNTVSPSQLHHPLPKPSLNHHHHLGLLNAAPSESSCPGEDNRVRDSNDDPSSLKAVETTAFRGRPDEYLNLSPILPEANVLGSQPGQFNGEDKFDESIFIW